MTKHMTLFLLLSTWASCCLAYRAVVSVSEHSLEHANSSSASAPASFYTELAKLKIWGYQEMFCGKNNRECATIDNYPYPGGHVEMRWEEVKKQLETVPARQRAGEIIKGNDLGFFILNQYLWADDYEYHTIGLGVSVEDHEFVRPFLDKILGKNGLWNEADIEAGVKTYLADKQLFDSGSDIAPFTTKLMHKIHLNLDLSDAEAKEFATYQAGALVKAILPDEAVLWGRLQKDDRKTRQKWLTKYMNAMEADSRGVFQGLTGRHPGGRMYVVAAALMDSLTFAGGLSVASIITTAMQALYSQQLPIEKEFRPIDEEDVEPFVYEVARLFPAVVGFAWWSPGYDANKGGNHYTHRTVMNLAMTLRDPRKWGDNYGNFVVRDLATYKELMPLAWALPSNEILESGKLGPMSRGCPGASLSMVISKAFIGEWVNQQASWVTTSSGGIAWKDATPFFQSTATFARVLKEGELTIDGNKQYFYFEAGSKLAGYASKTARVPDDAEQGREEFDLSKVTGKTVRSEFYFAKDSSQLNCFNLLNKVPWGPFKGQSWEDDHKLCAETAQEADSWMTVLVGAPF